SAARRRDGPARSLAVASRPSVAREPLRPRGSPGLWWCPFDSADRRTRDAQRTRGSQRRARWRIAAVSSGANWMGRSDEAASFAASLRAARSAVVGRRERESRLQRVRGEAVLLGLELANRDSREIPVLRLRRNRQTRDQSFDSRAKLRHTLRECFRSGGVVLARSLDEHPAAARLPVGDFELAQLLACTPQTSLVARIEVPEQPASYQTRLLAHLLDERIALVGARKHALDSLDFPPLLELSLGGEPDNVTLPLDRSDTGFELVLTCLQRIEIDAAQRLLERRQPLFVRFAPRIDHAL